MTYNLQLKALALIALLFVGCSKNEESNYQINQSEVKLKYDGDFAFTVSNASNIEWSSSDPFVGTVDINGNFTAEHIGETTITARHAGGSTIARVIVEPYITDIVEPHFNYGANKNAIKTLEKRNLKNESSTDLLYQGQGQKENEVYYSFSGGSLDGSILTFRSYSSLATDLARFYGERYNYYGSTDDAVFFESKDEKTLIGISALASIGIGAVYIRPSSSSRSAKLKMPKFVEKMKSDQTVLSIIDILEK
ncbi:Ig-like domain-containing protein [Sphingobacterium corticibacter]|uniref:BIG2 domain-containing protein n=1 Tax=Sphingobacterium corticibacter TaxID=2171749 RepID=A0A2T8HNH3_9SPHI|nr:Ig-like domain-containing protein [Sphingobacterium corticibacter]PVH26987.1 hypothetical protein DC487_05170 [Sphingobacterium corticibacter]